MPGPGQKSDPKDPSGFDDAYSYKLCKAYEKRGWCWLPNHKHHRKVNGVWYYRL